MFGKKYKKLIKTEGLTCPNCAKKAETQLCSLEGVTKAKVNLQANEIELVSKQPIDNDLIEKTIKSENFEVSYIKDI